MAYLGVWLEYGRHHGVGDAVQAVRRVQAVPSGPFRVLMSLPVMYVKLAESAKDSGNFFDTLFYYLKLRAAAQM